MRSLPRRLVPRLAPAVALAALTGLSGCGGGASPADDVPALARQLDRVDAAIAAGEYDKARHAVEKLVAVADRANSEGTIDADAADAIEEAADEVVAELPADARSSGDSDPSPAPTTAAPEDEGDSGEDGAGPEPGHEQKPKKPKEPKEPKPTPKAEKPKKPKPEHGKGHEKEHGPGHGPGHDH